MLNTCPKTRDLGTEKPPSFESQCHSQSLFQQSPEGSQALAQEAGGVNRKAKPSQLELPLVEACWCHVFVLSSLAGPKTGVAARTGHSQVPAPPQAALRSLYTQAEVEGQVAWHPGWEEHTSENGLLEEGREMAGEVGWMPPYASPFAMQPPRPWQETCPHSPGQE